MPAPPSEAAAVPVPTSFPVLVSPSHQRYSSTISALNDSYARTAAAQQRRATHQQQQARRDAQLAHAAQHATQQQLQRQFLFREHVLATVNHSKARRIQLECHSGLRDETAVNGSADWPRFETVDVRVEEWRCSGAKTRVLEEEGWKDHGKTREAVERVAQWQQLDRERELQRRHEEQQRRHAAIQARFTQQRELNESRAAYIRHHFVAAQPHHLTPPASFLDSVRGRRSRLDEKRESEDEEGSGRGSVLSTGRSSERLPRLVHRSFSASPVLPPPLPLSSRRRASHTSQPALPTIVDEDSSSRRQPLSRLPPRPSAAAAAAAAVAEEQRENEYDNSTFDPDTTINYLQSILPSADATLPSTQAAAAYSYSFLDPSSPFHADEVVDVPTPAVSLAVHSELQRFESKLPEVRERDRRRERPLYLTNHQRLHH